jgi:hypothetical protein
LQILLNLSGNLFVDRPPIGLNLRLFGDNPQLRQKAHFDLFVFDVDKVSHDVVDENGMLLARIELASGEL